MLGPRRLSLLAAFAAVALLAAGCGKEEELAESCRGGADAMLAALAKAPASVALTDGTRLHECVANARSDADIQEVGSAFTTAATRLLRDARADTGAALQLGYLAEAAKIGAGKSGIGGELARRIEQTLGGDLPEASRVAVLRGVAAARRDA